MINVVKMSVEEQTELISQRQNAIEQLVALFRKDLIRKFSKTAKIVEYTHGLNENKCELAITSGYWYNDVDKTIINKNRPDKPIYKIHSGNIVFKNPYRPNEKVVLNKDYFVSWIKYNRERYSEEDIAEINRYNQLSDEERDKEFEEKWGNLEDETESIEIEIENTKKTDIENFTIMSTEILNPRLELQKIFDSIYHSDKELCDESILLTFDMKSVSEEIGLTRFETEDENCEGYLEYCEVYLEDNEDEFINYINDSVSETIGYPFHIGCSEGLVYYEFWLPKN